MWRDLVKAKAAHCSGLLRNFGTSRSGNFAAITGIVAIPLLLAGGVAIDYSRYLSADRHLQEVADSAALALAGASDRDEDVMLAQAQKFVDSNFDLSRIDDIEIAALDITDDDVDVRLRGHIRTTFMGLAGYDRLNVNADSLAKRAVNGSVEVALVLDNTYSMAETDAKGVTKLASLKQAANALVTELLADPKADVKIGLVPYADYVNVGTKYRNEPWLNVPADYTVPAVAESGCSTQTVTVQGACTAYGPEYDCSTYVDGVRKAKTCKDCTARKPSTTKEQKTCTTPAKAAVNYKWYGCIGSRMAGTYRLNDTMPNVPYPGYVDTSQKCLNPIMTLTGDKKALKGGIDGMVYNLGSYEPYTYIPAGVIWGINVLSPTAPLTEGSAYDPANKTPRKAMLLMTDGENTRRFVSSNGTHAAFSSTAATAATQLATVNKETVDLCTYAKTNKIEVYSVAFMVDDAAAKKTLQDCATSAEHYFDASDPEKLLAAFSGIAKSLSVVRLAR